MPRLLDRLMGRPAARYMPPQLDPFTLFQTTYQSGDAEPIQQTFQGYAQSGYSQNSVVFSVVLARLMLFSEATFKFRNESDKRLFGTPDLAVLENPWPGGTTGELLARMEQDVSLAGNAFVRRWPDRLERLRPDWVDIVHEDRGGEGGPDDVVGYVYWCDGRSTGEAELIPVEDVAHWSPIPDPLAEFRGMSWLTPVVREVNADLEMTAHKQAFFENAATPNMLIRYQGTLGDGILDQLAQRLNARHTGPDNAFRTLVLDGGADVTMIGSKFTDMAFTALQAAGENRIAAAGGVPAIVVGLKEGLDAATYSNYELAMRRFADVTMRPLWRSAAAALAKLVNVPPGSRLWYDTTDIAALRQGEKERAETMQVQSLAAGEFIRSGYEPGSVTAAVMAGDLSLLTHTGAIPTALYPNGQAPEAPAARHETHLHMAEGAVQAAPTTLRIEPGAVDARTEVTIADGAIRNEVDATTAVLEGAVQTTVTAPQQAPRPVVKHVERDSEGNIVSIREEV